MRPKILYITVRSDFGGGPRHLNQLIENLDNQYQIYVACPKGKPYGTKWQHNDNIEVINIPYRRFSLKALLQLKTLINTKHVQIIHSHGNGAGIYSRLLKLLCPCISVVHTFHGISDSYPSKVKEILNLMFGRLLSPLANRYICVSNGEKEMAINRHFSKGTNTIVIYNGIKDPCHIVKTHLKRNWCFVTISRFDYQKNMNAMFRIVEQFKDEDRVSFIWVGDGEERMSLESKAKNEHLNITFTGFIKNPTVYMEKADWYISSSRFEGLPYGLIEAASLGLPILASNVNGNNEVVKDAFNGFLFKKEKEAIKMIREIIDCKLDYSLLSEHSLEYFKSHFTEKQMIDKLIQLYTVLLING